jgi:RNA polymerase sigma factor (sigma-70 family)
MTVEEAWEEHQRLVYGVAWKVHRQWPHHLEIEEKISAGYEGFVKAVEAFDPEKGNTFATFAWKCIERRIMREIEVDTRFYTPSTSHTTGFTPYAHVWGCDFNDDHPFSDNDKERDFVTLEAISNSATRTDPTDKIHFDRGLRALLSEMNREEQKIFRRVYLKHQDYPTIAKEFGVTRQAVSQRFRRVLKNHPELRGRKGKKDA